MPNDAGHGEMRVDNGYRFRPGELVCGRFYIIRFIARGGMGELYQAEDLELHEVVALKTIRPEIARTTVSTSVSGGKSSLRARSRIRTYAGYSIFSSTSRPPKTERYQRRSCL
jgi:serine/threonine protein kinase